MSERTMHQRMRDDEDHRLRMCGDLEADRDDPRVRFEREDFEQGHYDFIFASPPAVAGAFGGVASPRRGHGGGEAHDPDRPPTDGVVKGRPLPSFPEGGRPANLNPNGDA
jgi:hypothetical protein